MDLETRHNSAIPLISRLDHLDFMVKRLESKHESSKWTSRTSEVMPLDLALKEAYFKGSLIDRITSLERRLLQLLLEMDSSSSSRTSMLTPPQDTSSSHESKRELSSSSTTFNFPSLRPKLGPQAIPPNNKKEIQVQATSQPTEQRTKKSTATTPAKAHTRKNRTAGEANKSCKTLSKKQQKPRTPLYIRLLGC